MRMLEKFLVRIPERLNNTISIAGNELYLDNRFNEFEHRVVEGEVMSTPMRYEECPVNKGDTLYFHHHVVIDKGQKLMYEDDDIYIVNYHPTHPYSSQAFAYKNQQGKVRPLSNWVLLEPIDPEPKTTSEFLHLLDKEEDNERGKVVMLTEEMREHGLKIGDVVGFSKNSDYEINIDGTKYWRMRMDDLLYYVKD